MPASTTVAASGVSAVDSLLYGTKWSSTGLTFSFPDAVTDLADYASPLDPAYFSGLDSTQRLWVQQALSQWGRVTGLTFTEAANDADGDLRFYFYNDGGNLTMRVVGFPGETPESGDVQFGAAFTSGAWTPGTYTHFTILHEIGHALGLKHPHGADNGFPVADGASDGVPNSVMSYRSYLGGPIEAYGIASGSYPTAPMAFDIAAIQHLYGANWIYNSGDTVYSFTPTAAVIFGAYWDGGGQDTYNFASYTTHLKIDLRPGAWSDLGGQYALLDNVAPVYADANIRNPELYNNDLRSLIENATGGSGNDSMAGNQVANTLSGGAGTDSLDGGAGSDTLIGGSGDDQLAGGEGDDRLEGGSGADTLTGGAGADTFLVTDGDQVKDFQAGDRILTAGAVPASLTYSLAGAALTIDPDGAGGAGAITVDLAAFTLSGYQLALDGDGAIILQLVPAPPPPATPTDGPDLLTAGPAPLSAGPGGDIVLGSGEANWIHGNQGDDILYGYAGDDTLMGGQQNDQLSGGEDRDILFGDAGDDRLNGDSGDDQLFGGEGQDSAQGGAGNDLLQGNAGADSVAGGEGQDTLHGGQGDDFAHGNQGQDIMFGDLGRDTLLGGQGDDRLLGGEGADWLSGDLGADVLTGGAGADGFNFVGGQGRDTVTDFQGADGDRLIFARGDVANFEALLARATVSGGDVVITLADQVIVLADVQLSALTASDFLFV